MKRLLPVALISLMLSSRTFAGSCPMLKSEVESKMASLDQTEHATWISIALMLHEEGVKAHDSGLHAMSEELLTGVLIPLAVLHFIDLTYSL